MKFVISILMALSAPNAFAASGLYTCSGFAFALDAKVNISVKDMMASASNEGVVTALGMSESGLLENGQWQYTFKSLTTDQGYKLHLTFNEDALKADLSLNNTVDGSVIDLGSTLCKAL